MKRNARFLAPSFLLVETLLRTGSRRAAQGAASASYRRERGSIENWGTKEISPTSNKTCFTSFSPQCT